MSCDCCCGRHPERLTTSDSQKPHRSDLIAYGETGQLCSCGASGGSESGPVRSVWLSSLLCQKCQIWLRFSSVCEMTQRCEETRTQFRVGPQELLHQSGFGEHPGRLPLAVSLSLVSRYLLLSLVVLSDGFIAT
ncbi:uncharacterized protein V6R79_017758 [Siganus canaliculatus]